MRAVLYAGLLASAAGLSVTPRSETLYSSLTPKLRIQGEGFGVIGVDHPDVELEFVPPLTARGSTRGAKEKIYTLNVTEKALILGLKKGASWPLYGSQADGTTLFLSSIKVKGGQNQLEGPVPVAKVIAPPSIVNGEEKIIYATGTKKFLVNGTGFREGMTLTFDPPLVLGVDYEMNVRSETAAQLLLKTDRTWRKEPGPLKLRRVNVGGGALRVDPRMGGVTVAEVQADLGGHGVYAETTAGNQFVYASAKTIRVTGQGFDHVNTEPGFGPPKLRWANGIKGRGTNYTTMAFDANSVTLQRTAGSKWRRANANLPGPLVLLAADAGSGFVGLGPTEAKKGVRVATVFEDPSVVRADLAHPPALFRTHTAQLWLRGTGFVRPGTLVAGGYRCEGTKFTFSPALEEGADVLVTVYNRTHALVRLRQGRAWAEKAGVPLKVTAVQSGPMGPMPNFPATTVAMVVEDDAHDHPSEIQVDRSNHQVLYQTPTLTYLTISGSKLTASASMVFAPPLKAGVDYDVVKATASKLTLGLLPGRAWRPSPGPLILKSLETTDGGDPLHLAHGTGIVVADVVADPAVSVSRAPITASTTRRVSIRGAGFDLDGVEVSLEPTWASAYEVEQVFADEVVLKLKEGKAWTPSGSGVAYKIPAGGVPLVVTRVTTSAGDFVFKDASGKAAPVQVATIVEDLKTASGEAVKCDDTCPWALDGVCDDGSVKSEGKGKGGGRKGPGGGRGYAAQDDYAYGYGYDEAGGDGAYGYADDEEDLYDDDKFLEGGDGQYSYDEYEYGYDYFYGDEEGDTYGYYGDDWGAAACAPGTDCTDCGQIDADGAPLRDWGDEGGKGEDDDAWFDDDEEEWWDDDYDFGDGWTGFADDADDVVGIIRSEKATKKPHARHSGDHTLTHWYHRRRRHHGKEGPEAVKAFLLSGVMLGLVALGFFVWAFLAKLAGDRGDDAGACGPCKKMLFKNVDVEESAATDELKAALNIKAAAD
jgi:hypothetical protein